MGAAIEGAWTKKEKIRYYINGSELLVAEINDKSFHKGKTNINSPFLHRQHDRRVLFGKDGSNNEHNSFGSSK